MLNEEKVLKYIDKLILAIPTISQAYYRSIKEGNYEYDICVRRGSSERHSGIDISIKPINSMAFSFAFKTSLLTTNIFHYERTNINVSPVPVRESIRIGYSVDTDIFLNNQKMSKEMCDEQIFQLSTVLTDAQITAYKICLSAIKYNTNYILIYRDTGEDIDFNILDKLLEDYYACIQ